MKFVKIIIKKILILIVVAGLPFSWIAFDKMLIKAKRAAHAAIATSNINHKSELMRLKGKHKKEIAKLKLKNKKNLAKAKIKARSKHLIASIPIIGTVALLWTGKEEFEDYKKWLTENPNATADEYVRYKASLLVEP